MEFNSGFKGINLMQEKFVSNNVEWNFMKIASGISLKMLLNRRCNKIKSVTVN